MFQEVIMYFIPRKYKCPNCEFEMSYSQSHQYNFLPIAESGDPLCYKCLISFLVKNVPTMEMQPDKDTD